MTKLRFEYGLEVAFHVPGGRWPSRERVSAETERLRGTCRDWSIGHGGNPELYVKRNSQMNAEWRSPVLTTIEEIGVFYNYVRNRSDLLGLTREGDGFSTGGGHLHLSGEGLTHGRNLDPVPPWYKLYCAISQQPWIVWAFNDPEDAYTFNNCKYFFGQAHGRQYGVSEKHYVIAHRPPTPERPSHTVELRFFEAPMNLEEQLLHVKFADAWVSWVLGQPCMKPRKTFRPKQWSYEESCLAFTKLLSTLNLHLEDGLWKIADRNLTERYATGELV